MAEPESYFCGKIKHMKKSTIILVAGLALCTGFNACKKASTTSPASSSTTTTTTTTSVAANTFILDSTLSSSTSADINSNLTSSGLSVSAKWPVTLHDTSGTVGVYFKQKPTANGTYKIRHVYPSDNLATNEVFVDLTFGGCNYTTGDTSQTVTVVVSGGKVNVQFKNLNYSFNNWVVSGNPPARPDGKFSGNLNFQ
jgi:hypothetical protein